MEKEFLEIRDFLESRKVFYEIFQHEPVYTSEEAARVRGDDLSSGVKSLVFKADETFILVLVPGNKKADMNKIRNITNKKNVRLATPEEVFSVCNCEIGSVHPFGNLMQLPVYMEKSILWRDHVNFNVGLHTMSVRMNPLDLRDIIKPAVADIIAD